MMHRVVAPVVFVVLKHRKVGDPQRCISSLRDQLLAARNFVAERAQACCHGFTLPRDYQNRIALFRSRKSCQFADDVSAQDLQ